ncbi:GEVED domain-containing protein [Hydrocarboniphaga sp.]|uniref:GEVED domain-containing protein n=1 Tax=Hydrocarboniphaga sp. TaxID=2033016 RepID=UPI003D0B1204
MQPSFKSLLHVMVVSALCCTSAYAAQQPVDHDLAYLAGVADHNVDNISIDAVAPPSAKSAEKGAKTQRIASGVIPQGITAQAWTGIQQQIAKAQYEAASLPSEPTTIRAHNAEQDFRLAFNRDGGRVESSRNSPTRDQRKQSQQTPASLRLRTVAMTRGAHRQDAEAVQPIAQGPRVEYRRAGWTEWFINASNGLEHGYTIDQRPLVDEVHKANGDEVRILLGITGMQVTETATGGLRLSDNHGHQLSYGKLVVTDANGLVLPAKLETSGDSRIDIVFDDREAHYPLTVDPLLINEEQTIQNAGDGYNSLSQDFGAAVAVNDTTLLVGAPGANGYGAVYVFSNTEGSWQLQQQLRASDATADDRFGASVSLSADTILVGAPESENGSPDSAVTPGPGAAYIYLRTGPTWVEQVKLTGAGIYGDGFGSAVALSGDTALVGSPGDFGSKKGITQGGSAYVFVRSAGSWSQQQRLTASDGKNYDRFGNSVALSGDTALVGASHDSYPKHGSGSAYVFVRSGAVWQTQAHLIGSGSGQYASFGHAVALDGDTALIGGYYESTAYVFVRSEANWTEQVKLKSHAPDFGYAVALLGDIALIGARDDVGSNEDQGSAYLYARSGTQWLQQSRLTAADGSAHDAFGTSVALSASTAIVGAVGADIGGDVDQGAAYVFALADGLGEQQAKLTAVANGAAAYDHFGYSVALSGDTLLVGVPNDDIGSNDQQGSAYVFVLDADNWVQQARLEAPDPSSGDEFGYSVAVSGDTLLVGTPFDDTGSNVNQGSVYVFARTDSGWSQQAKLVASDGAAYDDFGHSVAIDEDSLLVGTPFDDTSSNVNQGSVYVFARTDSGWSQQARLSATGGTANDRFGSAVALSDGYALVGSPNHELGAGAAYVFIRSGETWAQQAMLTLPENTSTATPANLGCAVSISGSTALVGASGEYISKKATGAAHVYLRTGTAWAHQARLQSSVDQSFGLFGTSVSVAGDLALVGAPSPATQPTTPGSATVFARSGTAWTEQARLVSATSSGHDGFGQSVALAGSRIVIGSSDENVPEGAHGGAVHTFRIGTDYGDAPAPYPTVVADNGARHFINTDGPYLGSSIDAETDGQPNSGATGDDIAGSDDEDGVTLPKLKPGTKAKVTVVATAPSGTAQLDAWIDFNADGDWSDEGEQIFAKIVVSNGTNTLKFPVPDAATLGLTYARFRLSPADTGTVKATGKVIFGEVEDYIVKIKAP